MKLKKSKLALITIVFVLASAVAGEFGLPAFNALAQTAAESSQIAELNRKIAEYQAQLNKLGSDKKTLQAAIKALDLQKSKIQTQAQLTQKQIEATSSQIENLGNEITSTTQNISKNKQQLAEYLRQIQQYQDRPVIFQLLTATSWSDFWQSMQTTQSLAADMQIKTEELQAQQANLANVKQKVEQQQDTLSAQHDSLTTQQRSLTLTEKSKTDLLSQTKSQESQYQKLLAQAKAELDSYSQFTQNSGGSGLLGKQTVCDSWGCYYNQRDSTWGGQKLNGTQYTLASDGCLVTSMAMVMTHYGYKNVTPSTINANPANFASYYPAYLLYTITAGGVTASRKTAKIDETLAAGDPLVIGMKVKGGTHFVVLVSGSNGNYVMRDPYISGGKDISFNAHYTVKSIYSISKVVVN